MEESTGLGDQIRDTGMLKNKDGVIKVIKDNGIIRRVHLFIGGKYPTHTPMEDKLKFRAAGKKVTECLKVWKSTNIRSKSSWSGVSNLVMTL